MLLNQVELKSDLYLRLPYLGLCLTLENWMISGNSELCIKIRHGLKS